MPNLSSTEPYRNSWIDLTRVISTYFVIISHTAAFPAWATIFAQGGVFLFFILAGYFAPKTHTKSLKRTFWMANWLP